MSILITLKSLRDGLPNAEQKVADYILRQSDRVPYESVSEIARNVNVSVPSVTRLTKKLGFTSFKDFKVELAVGEAQHSIISEVFSQIAKNDTDSEIIDKMFLGSIKSLEDTLRIINRAELIRFAALCAASSRLVFIGEGSSGIICDEAALRFSHLDIQSEACRDTVSILLHTSRLKKSKYVLGYLTAVIPCLLGKGCA